MKFQDAKGTGPEQIELQLYNIHVYYKTALSTFFLQIYTQSSLNYWLIEKEQNTYFKILYNKTFLKSEEHSMLLLYYTYKVPENIPK